MDRRQFIVATASVTTALAGCVDDSTTDSEGSTAGSDEPTTVSDRPAAVVDQYMTALAAGNADAAEALAHPEATELPDPDESVELTINEIDTVSIDVFAAEKELSVDEKEGFQQAIEAELDGVGADDYALVAYDIATEAYGQEDGYLLVVKTGGDWLVYAPSYTIDTPSAVTTEQGTEVTNRLQVLEVSGLKTANDGATEIGVVELVATKAPGAEDIALEGITMQWVDSTGTYDLVHENVYTGTVDGAFAHEPIRDEDDSLGTYDPVITSGDDRVRIVIDLGAADYNDDTSAVETTERVESAYDTLADSERATTKLDEITGATEPARIIRSDEGGLDEGETASMRITTQSGTASTVTLTVPESLRARTATRL